MSDIITILKKNDLLGKKGPQKSVIDNLPLSKFVDIATDIEKTIEKEQIPVNNPFFSHSSSLHLGGGASECASLDCRILRINKLARFSLLYSDKVYINSFFSKYLMLKSKSCLIKIKRNFYNDLIVINEIKTLLQKGFIGLFSPTTNVCFACQADNFLGKGASKRFKLQYNKLEKTYLEIMKVTGMKAGSKYCWKCDGPAQYFDHGLIKVQKAQNHSVITHKPRIMNKLEKGEQIKLSKSLIKELELHTNHAHRVASNAIYGLATSKCLNTSFLTESDIHISFLNLLQESPIVQHQNTIAANNLTSIVPFVEDVKLNDIIKLRNREEEAFINYRHALKSVINEFTKSNQQLTNKDASSLYSDVIAPSLATLDNKVKQAKRDLISKPFRSFTGVVGSISFGMLTGLVSPDIPAIAKAIGLVGFGGKFISDLMSLGDSENAISNDHLYFLWKLKKKARK